MRRRHSNPRRNLSFPAKYPRIVVRRMAWSANDFCANGTNPLMDYLAAMGAFVRTVDLGSFSKAAAETGTKVSTVSRYVTALEADVGAALLNRSTRRLHLTEAGRTFYDRAVQIIAEVDEARNLTRSLNA